MIIAAKFQKRVETQFARRFLFGVMRTFSFLFDKYLKFHLNSRQDFKPLSLSMEYMLIVIGNLFGGKCA